MTPPQRSESGFTLIEVMVAIGLFSILSVTFYAVVFSGVRGSETARSTARVSEEARLGLNRMVRDTREAERLTAAATNGKSYSIRLDMNRDGDTTDAGELETFELKGKDIYLNDSLLARGIKAIPPSSDIFTFSSNLLQYDTNGNGIATREEIMALPPGMSAVETLSLLTNVTYSFVVTDGDQSTTFSSEAQLRNRR